MIKIGIMALEVILGLVVTVSSIILNPENLVVSAPEINMTASLSLDETSPAVLPVISP